MEEIKTELSLDQKIATIKAELDQHLTAAYTWEIRGKAAMKVGNKVALDTATKKLAEVTGYVEAYKAQLQELLAQKEQEVESA
jgi:hypothetical protein